MDSKDYMESFKAAFSMDRPTISAAWCDKFEAKKWLEEIPFIKFDKDWEIKIVPPFMGAVVRFRVKSGTKEISVYLDCYSVLGFASSPYWEAYPIGGDTARFGLKDTEDLLKAIREEIKNP